MIVACAFSALAILINPQHICVRAIHFEHYTLFCHLISACTASVLACIHLYSSSAIRTPTAPSVCTSVLSFFMQASPPLPNYVHMILVLSSLHPLT